MSNPEHPRITEVGRLLAENDRLREERDKFHDALEHIAAGDFAALAAENERLREALERIEDVDFDEYSLSELHELVTGIARAALAKEGQ
jgi:hypothetical protein